MQLAIEERDLQKMATLSQHDEKLDQLQSKLHAVQKVDIIFIWSLVQHFFLSKQS